MDRVRSGNSVVERPNPLGAKGSVHNMIRTVAGSLIGAFVIVPVTYMAADREPPFYRTEESHIVPNAVRLEEPFEAKWVLHVNKSRRCVPVGLVHRTIIDSAGGVKELEPVPAIADLNNKSSQLTRQMIMPMGVTAGPARYHAEACFACNPIQRLYPICITEPDISFTVLPHL
jgi:hypothetical protein